MLKLIAISLLVFKFWFVQAETDFNYRLVTPIKPISYAISITPYFDTKDDKAFTFDGEVTIKFKTDTVTNQIKLHSENLTFTEHNVTVTSENSYVFLSPVNPINFDTNYAFVTFNLDGSLQVGLEYSLKIIYRGILRSDLTGFYKAYYKENGVRKWLGATQMQATHARKVFPSFDEPSMKATFTLTIDRPENFQPSLANTKMQSSVNLTNGYIRETFYPTPIMSTYLVAFLVSEFIPAQEFVEGSKEFKVYTRPDAANQTDYIFDYGKRVVRALEEYFDIDYYSTNDYLKLHHVALPDFKAGAMENWGLITYRESSALYVPNQSAPYFKYKASQIIAHETTHMWFGDLVTCHWWSDTWLNEGFANYFQDYITNLIEPDVGANDMAVTFSKFKAYDTDNDPDSVPISNVNVNSPEEISSHFGDKSYQKAGAIIRMMHHLVGDDAFKFALRTYLRENKFSSGYPDLLYAALEKGVTTTNALAPYPEASVTDIMSSWITRAGYPLVDVLVDYEKETVTLSQNRYYVDSDNESGEIYKIPITYTTGMAPDFENTKPKFIFDAKSYEFEVKGIGKKRSWILFNIQETGLYRVNYDEHTWKIIANTLKSNRSSIHHLNRVKIVNDLFGLFFADEVDFDLLYNTFEFLHGETQFAVFSTALRRLNTLRKYYKSSDILPAIEQYQLHLLNSAIHNVGYSVSDSEVVGIQRNRQEVLENACNLGHQGCIQQAKALFKDFKENGTDITPSLRTVAYCTGLRLGTGEDFDFLWNRMLTANIANEGNTILNALSCTTNEDKLKTYLRAVLLEDSPIRVQDKKVPLINVLNNNSNVHLVIDEIKQNYTLWSAVYGNSMDTLLSNIAKSLHNSTEMDKFEFWLESCKECSKSDVKAAKKSIKSAKKRISWAEKHREDILKTLTGTAFSTIPSITMLIVFSIFVCLVS